MDTKDTKVFSKILPIVSSVSFVVSDQSLGVAAVREPHGVRTVPEPRAVS